MTTRRLLLTAHARQDLARLRDEDVDVLAAAIRVLAEVERDPDRGIPLRSFAKTGDLSDCFKVYIGTEARPDTHRAVFREHPDGTVTVVEVVAVAERADDLAYVLAALRLGRLDEPDRRADAIRRVRRAGRRSPSQQDTD